MNTMDEEMKVRARRIGMESKQRESYKQRTEDYVGKLYQK